MNPPITVPDHVIRQHRAEPLRAIAGAVRHDLGHKTAVIVVKDRAWHCPEEGKGMHMSIKPGFGVSFRISANIARITVRQIKGKKVRLLFDPANDNQRFAKVSLAMPWRMAQRHKHLPRAALLRTHIVFDNRIAAIKPAFIAQSFKYLLGCMALFARAALVFRQPAIDLVCVRIKLWPLDRCSAPVTWRFRVRQHLRNTVPADPKITRNLTTTQTVFKMSVTNLQIQVHGEYPQALPSNERAKVDDFYAARDNTMPPLPWPSIAPPITDQQIGRNSTRSSKHSKRTLLASWPLLTTNIRILDIDHETTPN
ncbi:hypothetical protein TRICHSKD4_5791 [Roseibium sp. TrichSKD4]|nr:hypothetical protein TRICHSKD4_5791 [Roseibium sp. TrichSKD4]